MVNIGTQIRERRERLGWTILKLATLAGLDPGFVSRVERGKSSYTAETLAKIAGAFAVQPWELYGGHANIEHAPMDWRRIPVIDYIQAGRWSGIDPSHRDAEMQETLTAAIEHSPSTFALRIRGDSMEPMFKEGDIVLIDPTIAPRPGDFVVGTDQAGEGTFKQYRAAGVNEKGHNIFELVPLNTNYAPLRSDRQQISIVGTMVEHRRYRRR